ncbi:hypothetical protein HAV15_001681 [Penicillium sp. str. |nr:hypothetical protein HAV15_001681 [Penicillium sp. str. \
MSSPLPIVICALDSGIGKPVSKLLLPEFEASQQHNPKFPTSSQAGILNPPHVNDVGTKDYSRPVRAIIFGRGFDLEDIEALRENVASISQDPVLWIAGDPNRKPPPGAVPPPNYHQLVAGVARKLLSGWVEAGATSNEVILY